MIDQPSYYTVIPAYVRYDKVLIKNAKSILVFGEIAALSNQKGYCWASNAFLGKRIDASESTVKRCVAQLIDRGYVRRKIIYKDGSKEVDKRILVIGNQPNLGGGFTNEPRGRSTDDPTPGFTNEPRGRSTDDPTPGFTDDLDNITRFEEVKEGGKNYQQHPLAYYQQAFGLSARGNLVMLIDKYANSFGNEIVNYAFDLASENGKDFAYAKGILNRWKKEKISTLDQAIKAHENHSNRGKQPAEPQAFETEDKSKGKAKIIAEFYSKYHDIDRVISEIKSEYDTKLSREEVEKYVGNGAGS